MSTEIKDGRNWRIKDMSGAEWRKRSSEMGQYGDEREIMEKHEPCLTDGEMCANLV